MPLEKARCRRLIDAVVANVGLDLSGLVVLTEAATGYYALTPLIAALAGADRVLGLTKTSRHGSAESATTAVMSLAAEWGVAERVQVLTSRDVPEIGCADIITNLGFVRPIDRTLISRLKPTAVIPLMWETWEFRPEDLDLAACRQAGIAVLGTNEEHPVLQTIGYVGYVAARLLFDLRIEIFRTRVLVVGSGPFAAACTDTLRRAGAVVHPIGIDKLRTEATRAYLRFADAIVFAEHHSRELIVGEHGIIDAEELWKLNPSLAVAHLCGHVDRESLAAAGLACQPAAFARPGYMSVATDYVGPRPLIDLHAAGLKVGQVMAECRREGLHGIDAELAALRRTPLAQGFEGYHLVGEKAA